MSAPINTYAEARFCYYLPVKNDTLKNLSSFCDSNRTTHDRHGPLPYVEFGNSTYWNPLDSERMLDIFYSVSRGFNETLKREPTKGDIAVVSDTQWQIYGIYTDKKKGYLDDNYNIIKRHGEDFGFLQVGDIYFGHGSGPEFLSWLRTGI